VLPDQRWAGSGQHGDGGFGADLAPCGRFEQDVEDELQAPSARPIPIRPIWRPGSAVPTDGAF